MGREGVRWFAWPSPFLLCVASGLMLWLAFPPVGIWPLGWLATLPWLYLISQQKMLGRRPYLQVWIAGLAYCVLLAHGKRKAQ